MIENTRFEWPTAALLLATLILLSAGQILFKLASAGLSLRDPRTLLSPTLIAALSIYGIATIMWILVLKKLPLSIAFPFYGFTFLFVPVLAYYFLGEKISYQTIVGGAIIAVGVFVTGMGRWG